MATKYQVTDSRGNVHKRTTENRTYTHAVVVHVPAKPERVNKYGTIFAATDAYSYANWCGRADLAHKEAARMRRRTDDVEVEIVEIVNTGSNDT